MSWREVGVSPVRERGLFTVVSLVSAWAETGEARFAMLLPAMTAVPAAAAPAMNARRFIQADFGVTSEEGMSSDLRINMRLSLHSLSAFHTSPVTVRSGKSARCIYESKIGKTRPKPRLAKRRWRQKSPGLLQMQS